MVKKAISAFSEWKNLDISVRAEEFAPLLKKALECGGIWIFDVEVDYSENMKLTLKLGENVCTF